MLLYKERVSWCRRAHCIQLHLRCSNAASLTRLSQNAEPPRGADEDQSRSEMGSTLALASPAVTPRCYVLATLIDLHFDLFDNPSQLLTRVVRWPHRARGLASVDRPASESSGSSKIFRRRSQHSRFYSPLSQGLAYRLRRVRSSRSKKMPLAGHCWLK